MPDDDTHSPVTTAQPPRVDTLSILRFALPLLVGFFCGALCYRSAGATLGLFLGGLGFTTLLTPGFALTESSWRLQLLAAVALATGTACAWLAAVLTANVTVEQWLGCSIVLLAYALALGSLARLLSRTGLDSLYAAVLAVFIGIAWLTSPVWLSHVFPAHDWLVTWLVPPHPLFALNGILHFPVWTERTLAYRYLTNLGQDVSFAVPPSILPCIATHGAIALLCLVVTRNRGPRGANQIET